MNDDHPQRLAVLIVLALTILAGSAYLFAKPMPPVPAVPAPVANPPQAVSTSSAKPKVTWSPSTITFFLRPGDIKQRTVSITSTGALQSVSIEAVPEIAPFVTIVPSAIAFLSPSQNQSAQIRIAMPVNATSSVSYDGTIHVNVGTSTVPQTLKITITVGLPPDPGAAGNATIAGVDSDGDGVRDDVQRYIGLTYPQSAKERAALSQAAAALQDEVNGNSNGVKEVGDALDCLGGTLMTSGADVAGGKNAHDVYLALRAVVLNTPDRAKAFFQADAQSGAIVRFSTPFPQRASRCSIDPSILPN